MFVCRLRTPSCANFHVHLAYRRQTGTVVTRQTYDRAPRLARPPTAHISRVKVPLLFNRQLCVNMGEDRCGLTLLDPTEYQWCLAGLSTYGRVRLKDTLWFFTIMGLSPGSGFLSVADISMATKYPIIKHRAYITVTKGDVKLHPTNQPTFITGHFS